MSLPRLYRLYPGNYGWLLNGDNTQSLVKIMDADTKEENGVIWYQVQIKDGSTKGLLTWADSRWVAPNSDKEYERECEAEDE